MCSRYFFLMIYLFWPIVSFSQSNFIPPQAFQYREAIKIELDTLFPNIPTYNYFPSLVEHESCISLKSKKCWSSVSELRSAREQGVGFVQITRTFREDGSVRFDTLSDMRNQYKSQLREASWDTIKNRPDLQIRMGVLMLRDNYGKLYNIKDDVVRLQMTDAAHNTGLGNVYKKRRACGLAKDCDPNLWLGNTEDECIGLTRKLYGDRTACSIVKNHVRDVFFNRLPKYQKQYYVEN